MCTPQLIQQAVASGQAAGIIPGQQVNPQDAAKSNPYFDPRQNDPRYANTASQISELFDMKTGQRIGQHGPPIGVPMVPITRAEFDEEGPVTASINSVPNAPIPRLVPIQTIQRSPTVGEILGIKPGTTQEVGGPGRF